MDDAFVSLHQFRRLEEVQAPHWRCTEPSSQPPRATPVRHVATTMASLRRNIAASLVALACRLHVEGYAR